MKYFGLRLLSITLCLFCANPALSQSVDGDCASDMEKIGSIANRYSSGGDGASHTCQRCPGTPGKRGPLGPPGEIGPKGPKGDRGSCICDLADMERRMREMREDFERMISRNPEMCYSGISTSKIPISQISASSVHSTCPFSGVRLNSGGSWCTASNNVHQWVQVDFVTPRRITGILTQGRRDCCNQFVRTYKVSHGNTLSGITFYEENGSAKVFPANNDKNSIVKNVFSLPITARYFRIHPITYHGHMSMRFELLEC